MRLRGRPWAVNLSPTFPPYHVVGFCSRSLRYLAVDIGFEVLELRTHRCRNELAPERSLARRLERGGADLALAVGPWIGQEQASLPGSAVRQRPSSVIRAIGFSTRMAGSKVTGRRVALALAVATTVASLAVGLSELPARVLAVEDPLEPADAALVMTGDPGFERTKAAAKLVRDGTARLLILTGGEPWPGDSAESLRDMAEKHGVPANASGSRTVRPTPASPSSTWSPSSGPRGSGPSSSSRRRRIRDAPSWRLGALSPASGSSIVRCAENPGRR